MKNEISKAYFNKLIKSGESTTPMINFGTKKQVLDKTGNIKLFVIRFNQYGIQKFQSIKEN
jgi:hypothetical protein